MSVDFKEFNRKMDKTLEVLQGLVDRKSVGEGERGDVGGCRVIKKK